MSEKVAHQKYRNIQISTVDRGRLLLMMYDGAVKFLKQAKTGLETKDPVKFARFLSKAQAVIAELENTLDFEAGGDIARDLSRLYDFMLFYLTEANLQKSPEKIQRVIDLLETISGAYRAIVETNPQDTQKKVEELEARLQRKSEELITPKPAEPDAKTGLEPITPRQLRVSY